jgi:RNA polymerase sigma-70 factor (ECF subfamily)
VTALVFLFATEWEQSKFEFIFNRYRRLMLHKAYGILQDYALAEDAASEAFIRVYKNLHKIDDPQSPKCAAFVMTIVQNAALTMRRKQPLTEELDGGTGVSFDQEESIVSRLTADHIYRIVGRLSAELREVFLLRYAYDMPHKEIGRVLGVSENNVTVRLHRAKKKLQTLLREEGITDEP